MSGLMNMKLPINTPEDAMVIGRIVARSGMFDCRSDEAGAMIALMCNAEDMSPLEFLRTFHLIDGKPTMKADVMLAKFLQLGGHYDVVERSDTAAEITLNREGAKAVTFRLTFDEVKKAGYCYGKDGKTLSRNWSTRTKNMLWARVISDAVRVMDPRVNAGIYTAEEMSDEETRTEPAPKPVPAKAAPTPAPEPVAPAPTVAPSTPAPVAPLADPFADLPEDPVDYSVCPVGKNTGKAWSELPRDTLAAIVQDPKMLTKKHVEAVKAALEKTPF